jgi:uncharacterized membrane protein YhaH (DUF805 family)
MKKITEFFEGRIGRFNYLLSILIVVLGLFYIDWFCNDNRCLVCHPIMSVPWRDLFWNTVSALGGIYTCPLICFVVIDEGLFISGIGISIICTLFIIVQTIRRCHDRKESGWRILIPFYALVLLFLPGKLDKGYDSERPLFLNTLMKGKWLLLILILMIGAIYWENSWYIQRHKSLYSSPDTTPKLESRSGDICPKCQSNNVANIVYGYPAKRWGALAEDKKSYFHGCVLPKNPKKYHCNDCKYEWGWFRKRTKKDDGQNL